MACAPSGHLVRFLFAPQRSATPLGAQTGKSVFRRHSRAASAVPVLRFIDSPSHPRSTPRGKRQKTAALQKLARVGTGFKFTSSGALGTNMPRRLRCPSAIELSISINHQTSTIKPQPSLAASVLPRRHASPPRFGYHRDFPNPLASSPPLSRRCLHLAIRVW